MNIHTITDLKQAAKNAGSHYFSASTMRFFNSRVEAIYPTSGTSGYFVTSERFEDEPRLYSVRSYTFSDGADITSLDDHFQAYTNLGDARKAARELRDA